MDEHDDTTAVALKGRVEAFCADAGRDVVVGVAAGRGHPRYTVTERGHSRVPLASWSASWDGWEEKAMSDLRAAGLLPDEKEGTVPPPTQDEKERSIAIRPRLKAAVARYDDQRGFIAVAVTLMRQKGIEEFGGGTTTTAPAQIADIQLGKFLADETASMMTRNLDKWESVLDILDADDEQGGIAPVPDDDDRLERTREELAERDDELADARRRIDDLESEARDRVVENDLTEPEPSPGSAVEVHERPRAVRVEGIDDFESEFGRRVGPIVVGRDPLHEMSLETRRRYADTLLRHIDRNPDVALDESMMRRLDMLSGLPESGE